MEFCRLNNVKLHPSAKVYGWANLYDCEVGENSRIGTFVEIQKGVKVGKNCKIQSHAFICEGVTLEDGVFIGHGVMFTNDRFPRAVKPDGSLKGPEDWKCESTLVKRGASIGSNATILSGLTIGENALVGAGSVVTKDVEANTIVAGNPAKKIAEVKE